MGEPTNNWRQWLDEYAERFLLFARQQTRRECDAEDVLQESLVETWKKAENSTPPSALVFATIRRRAIDLGRATTRRELREQTTVPEIPWLEPNISDGEEARILESAVRQLKFELAEVITLKIWGGLTFREIAEALDIPQNTAASRYRYALAELRKNLKTVLQ